MKKYLLIIVIAVCFFVLWCNNSEKNIKNIWKAKGKAFQQLQNFSDLSAEEFRKLKQTWKYEIIDIRSEHELKEEWWIPNYQKIEYYSNNFINKLKNLEKDKKYLIYCNRGNRTAKVLKIMEKMWFKEVYHLWKWIQGRKKQGYEIKN